MGHPLSASPSQTEWNRPKTHYKKAIQHPASTPRAYLVMLGNGSEMPMLSGTAMEGSMSERWWPPNST